MGKGSQLTPARSASSGVSPHPCAGLPGRREARVRVCRYWGHSPSREPVKNPALRPGPGIPSPSTEIPARPLPTLLRRESGRAGDKETPASSTLGPSARPRHSRAPSLDPGDNARGHAEERRQSGRVRSPTRSSWRLAVLPARGLPVAAAPPPSAPQTVPGSLHSHPQPKSSPGSPAERQGGAAHTKRA